MTCSPEALGEGQDGDRQVLYYPDDEVCCWLAGQRFWITLQRGKFQSRWKQEKPVRVTAQTPE